MIRCREIEIADLDGVADLLTRGFAGRSRDYWIDGLRRMSVREAPEEFPRFGYMLDHKGTPVGVLLSIYTTRDDGNGTSIRCNLSSWYVEPVFRNYSMMMAKVTQRHRHVTYINISPAQWTWRTIETQGFRADCSGLFFSFPALSRPAKGTRVEVVQPDAPGGRRVVRSRSRACAARRLRLPQPGVSRARWPRLSVCPAADVHPPDRAAGDADDLLPRCGRLCRLRRGHRPLPAAARPDLGRSRCQRPHGGPGRRLQEPLGRKYFKGARSVPGLPT
jgi:hypothetical protein